jgi:hypothetical protein
MSAAAVPALNPTTARIATANAVASRFISIVSLRTLDFSTAGSM